FFIDANKAFTMYRKFIFATGIENSVPVIGKAKKRVDELEKCGHYNYWQKDFDLVKELGVHFLRYGPPIYSTYLGHQKYDWSFADLTFKYLQKQAILPITDLCHFGVPDWIG